MDTPEQKYRPIIFCDFDGTISVKDSLVHLLDLYADPNWRDIEVKVKSGEIGTKESLTEEFNGFRATWETVKKHLLEDIEIDPHFTKFLSFCREIDMDLIILSGGFTSFISLILSKYGITGVPFYANEIHFKEDRATLSFPHTSLDCRMCGHCKTQHLRKARENGYNFVIYIGDGTTDRCPIKESDLVFAKDSLARYCTRENIPFVNWSTFQDIKNYLKENLIQLSA
ncbi:MAG: MtnX-like HAD-IB family phosphatase [Candidatus Auribacterota bacterium]